jgi:hypothetical protein
MTAAPHLVDGEPSYTSPELALVDAVLAAELRRGLRLVEDSWVPPRAPVEEAPTAIEEDEPAEPDLGDVLGEAAFEEVEPLGDDYIVEVIHDDYAVEVIDADYMVEVIDDTAPAQHANPHYPVLPSPRSGEEAIETDAALRQIRERMVDDTPARKKRLRRRFTVASGASVVFALGILAVDVQLHVAQLPDWLRF